MHVVLVPGLWMAGSSWDRVAPLLEAAGHRVHRLTPRGMASHQADRTGLTLRDHVDDLVELIDALRLVDGGPPIALVGHAEGAALVHAAVDARPHRVARAVHVAGVPRSHGRRGPVLPVVDGEVPMPEWWELDETLTLGLDDESRVAIQARAVPSPAGVLSEPQELNDVRRLAVPTTVVACTRPSSELRRDVMRAAPGTDDLALFEDLTWVDLPSSHWPQLTQPDDLAAVLVGALAAAPLPASLDVGRTG